MITLPWTEYTTRRNGYYGKWQWIEISRINELRSVKDADVFHSIWEYAKPDHGSSKVGDFYFDLDNKDLEKAKEDALHILKLLERNFAINPSSLDIGFSGNRGFFIIIPRIVFLTEPIRNPEKAYKNLAMNIEFTTESLDLAIYGSRRMWRMTNTRHMKSCLYRIPLTVDELERCSPDEIRRMASEPRIVEREEPSFSSRLHELLYMFKSETPRRRRLKLTKTSSEVSLSNLPKKYAHLSSGVGEGERNNALCQLAGVFEACGLSRSQALNELLVFNRRCSPPLPEKEVEYKLKKLWGDD